MVSSHPAIAALTAPELETLLLPPDRVGLPSSWWGHVPFAHWLVRELKPRLVVELGTQHGISFSAFCNAVRRDELATRCFAVDTWQGDEHSGFYDQSVFNSISASVRQNYSSFATLLRSSFDSAIGQFAEGSIDLLHIDGLHTYDAVKADFESWLPKVSDRGVVLFHDTAIYERGFGVWQFWKEISQCYPSFEFHHSCGLGVLAPGNAVPDFISALTRIEPAVALTLRHRLAELGERWISVDERVRASITIDTLNRRLQQAQAENTSLQHEVQLRGEAVETVTASCQAVKAQVAGLARDCDALRQQLASVTQDADRIRLQLEQVRTSTSWRVMGPYRIAGRLLKRHVLAPLVASQVQRQEMRDFKLISTSNAFNASFYLGRECAPGEEEGAIMDYLAASREHRPRGRQNPGVPLRRPMLGFHPLAYAEQCRDYDETTGEDPLAHYLRTDMPNGPWKHDVIPAHTPTPPASRGQRILIHAHFHYPDLLEELLRRLRGNSSTTDLFLTTTSDARAAEIREILRAQNETATIVVVPNRGRNIGPLLMHFPLFERYDIIGHVHGKRSPQQPGAQGNNWRNFLWDHLIGSDTPMTDVIAEAFATDERLGVVWPEDPNLNHWDMNQSLAKELADRLKLRHALPQHFEFPKGTMFWARPAALRLLVDLDWSWETFPNEPAASDGTILHALERVIMFAAEHAGFGFKAVHVPHSWRMATRP
jgi:Rhamnan synthesis protein F/Methyltransferase domain